MCGYTAAITRRSRIGRLTQFAFGPANRDGGFAEGSGNHRDEVDLGHDLLNCAAGRVDAGSRRVAGGKTSLFGVSVKANAKLWLGT